MKPNAGLPVLIEGEVRCRAKPGEFARQAAGLVRAGAEFIRALRRILRP